MKNPIVIVLIVVVVTILGFGAYTFFQNSSQSDSMMNKDEDAVMTKDETSMQPIDELMKNDESAMKKNKMMNDKTEDARYIQFSKSAFDSASNGRRVLFFYASWCPTCKPADTSFTQNVSKIPEDVTLIRVNYNDPETDQEEKDLAKRYEITYQHTFVQIDGQGNEVTKWNGGKTDELLVRIK